MSQSGSRFYRFAIFCLLLSAVAFLALRNRATSPDTLPGKAQHLTGTDAVNCGHFVIGEETEAWQIVELEDKAKDCAVQAFREHKAFHYRWERNYSDNLNQTFMMVGDKSGRLFQLWGEQNNRDENNLPLLHDVEYLQPRIAMKNERARLTWTKSKIIH